VGLRSTRHSTIAARPLGFAFGVLLAVVVGGFLIFNSGGPAPPVPITPLSVFVWDPPTATVMPTITRLPVVVTPALAPAASAPGATPTPLMVVTPAPTRTRTPLMVVRAGHGGPVVRRQPNKHSLALSGLYLDTYLPVYAQQVDAQGVRWYQVRLWGTLTGWIRADQTETGDPPPPTPSLATGGSPAAPAQATPSQVYPLIAQGMTTNAVNLRSGPNVATDSLKVLDPNTPLQVRAWQTDNQPTVWYQTVVNGQTGWVWAGAVSLITPRPGQVRLAGQPIWSSVAGKGMWLPSPLLAMADPDAVVAAANALGLTHIYLEVGDSRRGFYGKNGIDRLLPAAHRANLKVIGWVLTSLSDLPNDVALSTSIASYRTPGGDRLDGLAPDIEENMDATDVAAFSQILRAKLGTSYLIVGVIYPVGTWTGQHHPVAATLSHSFNALAPMAYWHDTSRPYTAAAVASFIRHSVADIHNAVGDSTYPVAVIGQTYDAFSRDGTGPNNPTGSEITTMLQAARQAGAIGVSLFQWGTTTPAEWNALKALEWGRS
jgi:hypothetical protein